MSDPSVDPEQPEPPDASAVPDPAQAPPAQAYRGGAGKVEIAAAMARATSVSRRFGAVRYALVGLDADDAASTADRPPAGEARSSPEPAPEPGTDGRRDRGWHRGGHRGRHRDEESGPWPGHDTDPDGGTPHPGGTP